MGQHACDRFMESKTSDLNTNLTMMAAETFKDLLVQIQNSNFNFKLNLSPFAANISLKKTFVKDKSGIPSSQGLTLPFVIISQFLLQKTMSFKMN